MTALFPDQPVGRDPVVATIIAVQRSAANLHAAMSIEPTGVAEATMVRLQALCAREYASARELVTWLLEGTLGILAP